MKEFFTNPIVVVPAIAWMISQFIKFGLQALKGDVSLKNLVKSGNMPSVHSAVVTALVVSVGFVEGVNSSLFGVALVFAMIVIYDALNVRRAVGEQGGILERLLEMQKTGMFTIRDDGTKERVKVSEVLGHSPLEVAAGAALGLVVATLLLRDYWPTQLSDYIWNYGETELLVAKIVLIIIAVVSVVAYLLLKRKKLRKLPSSRKLSSRIAYGLLMPSIFGLFVIWSNEIDLQIFSSKLWLILIVFWMVVYSSFALPSGIGDFFARKDSEAKELRDAKKRKRQKRRKK